MLSTWRLYQISQEKDSVLQDCPSPLLQTPVANPRLFLCFWPTCYRLEVLTISSLGSFDLLKWLTELRETPAFPSFLKYMIKDSNQQPDEEMALVREKGVKLPCPQEVRHSLQSPRVHQHRSSLNLILLGFYGDDVVQSDKVTDSWLIQPSSSPPPPREVRLNWNFQLLNHRVGPPGNQPLPLGRVQKSPSLM